MNIGKKISAFLLLSLGLNFAVINNAHSQVHKENSGKRKVSQSSAKNNKKTSESATKSVRTVSKTTKVVKVEKNKRTEKGFSSKTTTKKIITSKGGYAPRKDVIYSIYDLNSSEFLEKNKINSLHSIASLTKLMSSYVFLKETPSLRNCNIQITSDDRDTLKNTRSHLEKNTPIDCKTILDATLSLSDNYAASSLSRSVPNLSREAFVQKMNEQARKWKMTNTFFADPSGLNPDNKSTANDLTLFLANLIKTNEYKLMQNSSTHKDVDIPSSGTIKTYHNTNKLIREDKFDAQLSKTGYISESGYNLMFIPENCANNKKIALVIMGERTSYNRSSLATKLLNKYNCN